MPLGSLFLLLLSLVSCQGVQIKDEQICAAAGKISAGANCSHLLTTETSTLTLDEFLAFLEADPSTGRGAALCMSPGGWGEMKTELETACRYLGSRCSKQVQAFIARLP